MVSQCHFTHGHFWGAYMAYRISGDAYMTCEMNCDGPTMCGMNVNGYMTCEINGACWLDERVVFNLFHSSCHFRDSISYW